MRAGPLKLKLQLMCGESYAFGPGKADLLDAIVQQGSISGAGRALGMSYRRAWMLVDEMNRAFHDKLVETQSGGGSAKGARVTRTGHEVLVAYRAIEAQAATLAGSAGSRQLASLIRDTPLPADSEQAA